MRVRCISMGVCLSVALGCADRNFEAFADEAGVDTGLGEAGHASGDDAATAADGGEGARLDLATEDPSGGSCQVMMSPEGGLDGPSACASVAPPDSFEPEVQWAFAGPTDRDNAVVQTTPLVANLTDDNGDGRVDLCDTPDVVVVMSSTPGAGADLAARYIYVLDGATGELHYRIDQVVTDGTPAVGDINGDGAPDIITKICETARVVTRCGGPIAAYDGRDGSLLWKGSSAAPEQLWGCHIALADADNDGDVEIACGSALYNHRGELLFEARSHLSDPDITTTFTNFPTFADLDGDDDLEIIHGVFAVHHDGALHYKIGRNGTRVGGPVQIANFDADEDPEILVTSQQGLGLVQHDGTVSYWGERPTGVPESYQTANWNRAAVVHDFDGDGEAEFAMSSQEFYTVYEADASILWSVEVLDFTGAASGTAFDFLGDGIPEAMYGAEDGFFVFGDQGMENLRVSRLSKTLFEYPVVADVDNDGSAEIVVVSNVDPEDPVPAVRVIREVEDRWIQARRIWNQHTYHVTNVAEDGSIPRIEAKSWLNLNTFRANAQIEGDAVCRPEPVG